MRISEPCSRPMARRSSNRVRLTARVVTLIAGAAAAFGSSGSSAPPSEGRAPARPRAALAAPAPAAPAPALAVADAPPALPALEAPAMEPPARPVPLVAPGSTVEMDEFYVHVPPNLDGRLEVLVALHGMEGTGPRFASPLEGRADAERWVVVAPTFPYGDWQDPAEVAREDTRFPFRLHTFLRELPARTGLDLEPRAAIYGASRGGQLAHRFALVYPEQTQGVAAVACGTYTLPLAAAEVDGQLEALPYPFGLADLHERFGREFDLGALRRVPFWIGVGDRDREPSDVPRRWDPYIGDNRVARAERFAQRLQGLGVQAEVSYFPNLGHTLTDEMHARALDFLAALP
jgi:pimeloyl-ACP methyl ester carboxylesterase